MAESIAFKADPTDVEAPVVAPEVDPDRPEWLPENMKTGEDLAKSYKELQAEFTKLKQTKPDADPVVDPVVPEITPGELSPEDQASKDKLTAGGIDYDALQTKFMETGKIDAEDYAAVEKLGFTKAHVDAHIAAMQAAAEKMQTETMALAGGKESFAAISEWARASYSPEDLASYNKAIDSNDLGTMQMAVKSLKADYDKANGTRPNFLSPTNTAPQGGDAYLSMAQFLKDVGGDPYKTDPAERARVEAKLSRSKI